MRWQGQTIKQLSTAFTVVSGLSLGGLGLCLSLLQKDTFSPKGCYAISFLVAIGCFILASAFSIGAIITRLLDFRLTAQKVRKGEIEEPLTYFGSDANDYSKATWRLFWLMVVCFSTAVAGTVIVIVHVYLGRIIDAVSF